MTESWRPVVGWVGFYEVSDRGAVRAVTRTVVRANETQQTWVGRHLAAFQNASGYLVVRLSRPGKRSVARVHRLVAEAFLPAAHTSETVNHKNGLKTDNRAENLEWATRSENTQHAIANGLGSYAPPVGRGERGNATKLTEAIVLECRRRKACGEATRALAKEFGVDPATMRQALRGDTWAHLPALSHAQEIMGDTHSEEGAG